MKLFHRHEGESQDADRSLAEADYDAQADLALPTGRHRLEPDDVVAPFAGMLVDEPAEPGYDVDRDTAP